MALHDVDVRLRLLNSRGFVREMRASKAELQALGAQGVRSAAGLVTAGSALRRAGGTMTRHLTLPIVGASVALSKYAMDFHQQMTLIQTQAGASSREVSVMTGHVMDLSKQFGIAPTEIAKALFHIESVGLHGPKALDALTNSVKGSVVGLADLESVSTTLAGTWLTRIVGSGRQFHDVMAELNATVGAGNIRMDDLVNAIGTGILPVAKEAHLRLRDVTGALALMTDEGMPANMAMRLLRTSLNFVVAPTTKATKALDGLFGKGKGQTAMAKDIRKPQGLLRALRDLHQHLEQLPGGARGIKAGQILRDLFPAGRGVPLHILLNQLDRYDNKMSQIGKIHSRFDKSVQQQLLTPAQRWRIMVNKLRIAAIQLGDVLLPVTMAIGTGLAYVGDKFANLPPGMKKALVIAAAIGATIGPVTWALGVMVGGFGRAWMAGTKVFTALKWIYFWQKRVAAGQLLSGWATQGRNAAGQFLPMTWKNQFARRMGFFGRAAGIAFRIAFVAAALAIAYELYQQLVGPFNKFLEDKFGVVNATDPTGGKAQQRADQRAARQGVRRKPRGDYVWHIKSAQEPWEGWVLRRNFHRRPRGRGWGGTVSRTGPWMVGERGPEEVTLPAGARVTPLTPTVAAAFAGGGGGDGSDTHFHLYLDGKEINTSVTKVEKRRAARK